MKNETVVVTGASGGIGSGVVSGFLEKGYEKIVALYRTPSHVEQLRKIFNQFGKAADDYVYCADLVEESQVQSVFDAIEKKHGAVAGVVNCVGSTTTNLSWKLSVDEFEKIHQANVLAPFLVCKAVLPSMLKRNKGRIVNISSVLSEIAVPGTAHYAASKAALNGLTRTMASEVASKDITINAIALGYFDAGMIAAVPEKVRAQILVRIPKKRFGKVSEIIPLLDYLLGDDSSYTTGQVFHVNGGLY